MWTSPIDTDGSVRYPMTDREGTVIAQAQAGKAKQISIYDVYGESAAPISEAGPGGAALPFRYTGQRLDPWTGFYNYKARDYAPALGRFLQPDPAGLDQGPNLYAYVLDDPLSAGDPSGNCCGHGGNACGGDISGLEGVGASSSRIGDDNSTGAGASMQASSNEEGSRSAATSETLAQSSGRASSSSSGRTTIITHANGTVEARTGTPAFRDNNPGNIHPGDFTRSHGQIGVDPGMRGVSGPFAVFEYSSSGKSALAAMMATPQVGSRTIEQEMARYASNRGDRPAAYAREIAGRLGVTVTTRISNLAPAQRDILVDAIATHEGSAGTVRFIQP